MEINLRDLLSPEMLRDMGIDPDKHAPRTFAGSKNTYTYYTSKNGRRQFCWTVRPDKNGDYWTWDYVRTWKSRRKPKDGEVQSKWRATKWVRCAKRSTAKAKATRRYHRYHKKSGDGVMAKV